MGRKGKNGDEREASGSKQKRCQDTVDITRVIVATNRL